MKELNILLAKRIREHRKKKRYSQEKLAELSGLHSTYIGQIERCEKNPSIESLQKIADGLELSLHELLPDIKPSNKDTEFINPNLYNFLISCSADKQEKILELLNLVFSINK